jgi:hypothetical protein
LIPLETRTNAPQSRLSGIQQFLVPAGRILSRTPVASAIYGGGRAVIDPLEVGSVDAFEPRSVMGIDPSKRIDREFFLEDFEQMSDEQKQAALEAENASRSASRALATAGRVAGTVVDPLLELGQDVFNMPVTERRLETAAAEAQDRNRPLTMDEFKLSLLSKDPARNERILNDRRERVRAEEQPADVAESARLGSELLSDLTSEPFMMPGVTPSPDVVEDVTEDADIAKDSPVTTATEGTDPGTAVREVSAIAEAELPDETKGAAISDVWKNILSSDENPINVNELVLEMAGKKDPEKSMSRKESIQKNIELHNEIFGEDPDRSMKEDGFNLAYLGFAIAAGDSPNALQNIARGSMAGLKKISETQKARKEREDRAKMFGLTQTLKEESDIKKEEQRMFELKFGANLQLLRDRYRSDEDLRKFAATQVLAENRLDKEIQARIDLQNQRDISAAERARLERESLELRNLRSNLPEASVLWSQLNPDEDITTPEGAKALIEGTIEIAAQLGTEEGAGSRKYLPFIDFVSRGLESTRGTEGLIERERIAGLLETTSEQLTDQQLEQHFADQYRRLQEQQRDLLNPTTGTSDAGGSTQRITLEPDAE